ncbi:MAG: efflux RND transporter periplasmic adaptor subunit [Planctomycetes bacterium]|nr:efflux RND transporter periplasmic adaptor subunit [Planctomycetota bacterium]MBI3845195.1 efflux RND transporter periplasmic adaptor subunit [Planctomycetota bacterium]
MTIRNEPGSTGRSGPSARRVGGAPLGLVVAALVSTLIGCKPKVNAFVPPPPPDVTVSHAIRRPVTRYLEYTGTTEGFQTVDLRARVAGFLEQVNFKPGARVKKDDLLFVIDKRTYQAAVDKAQAQVFSAEAAFKAAESDARIAEELAAQRAGSEIDKITKIGKRDSAKAAVEASRAALESAKLDLEFCDVRAPIDGRITKNLVDVGNLVGAAGQPTLLATLVSAQPLYVAIDASESDVLAVRRARLAKAPDAEPGQIAPGEWRPVDLATADQEEFLVHGHVDYVDPALNPQTGTIHIRCRFENENEVLLPGMFVRVRILMETSDATLVPDIALQSDQSGRYALVVNEHDVVEVHHVKIGALDGSMRVFVEGIADSDRIVVNGLQRARPGAVVKATFQDSGPIVPVGN